MNARDRAEKAWKEAIEYDAMPIEKILGGRVEKIIAAITSALTVPEGCFDVLTKEHQNALDIAISRTPSGPDRNALTDISIVLMAALAAKKEPA